MRKHATVGLLTTVAVTVLGLPGVAAAETPAVFVVDNTDAARCSDGGQGTATQPFCTVGAGVAAAGPGQTVEIRGIRGYQEQVSLRRVGEPGKPVVLRGAGAGPVEIYGDVDLTGVHDVVVESLAFNRLKVTDSSAVTLDGLSRGDVAVVGASRDVTLRRSDVATVTVGAGATDTKLLRDSADAIRVTDAPRTTLTGNTVAGGCTAGIELTGASPDSNLYNNVVRNHHNPSQPLLCGRAEESAEIVVSAASAKGIHEAYNTVAPYRTNVSSGNAYSWAGTLYQTPESLAAATGGQAGGHDLVATNWTAGVSHPFMMDNADVTAPGYLPPALAPADHPYVANTGTGIGYVDRGEFEQQEEVSISSVRADQPRAPLGSEFALTVATAAEHWPTTVMSYTFDFGDGTPILTSADPVARHTYARTGDFQTRVTASVVGGRISAWGPLLTVTVPGQLKAGADVHADIPTVNDFGDTPALGVVVDPSSGTSTPWSVSKVVVDFGDGTVESATTLDVRRHGYASPGDYTVTVTVTDSSGRTDTASRPFKAAYAPSGYLRTNPYRLLDTRTDPQVSLQGGRENTFTIPTGFAAGADAPPANISSVVLNITVTDATEDTHLSVWPTGQPRPKTSNVNVAAGRASANLVTVPVGQAHAISTYLNSGRGEIVVDVVGFYRPNSGYYFTPLAPARLLDTRATRKIGVDEVRPVKVAGVNGVPADVTSVVLNLTSTETSTDTYVTVYPGGAERPVSSNLNPEPLKDKANQVIVPVGADGTVNVFNHNGATHVILDVFGYFSPDFGAGRFVPTVPVRLLDTRTTPFAKPGSDSTTVVGSIPPGAVAAVLNVTATNTTGDSYLTVHGHGTARPGTSNLNLLRGATIPNHVTTPVSPEGKVDMYNHVGSTDVIADLFGYYVKG